MLKNKMFLSPLIFNFLMATVTVFSTTAPYGASATLLTQQQQQHNEKSAASSLPLAKTTTTSNLRGNRGDKSSGTSDLDFKVYTSNDITLHVEDNGSGHRRLAEMGRENGRVVDFHKTGKNHVFTFQLGDNRSNRIHIRSSPKNQELTIRKIGSEKKNALTEEDRQFLQNLINTARGLPRDLSDEVDTPEFQVERLAGVLKEWPQDLDLDFVFDKHKEMDRLAGKADFEATHPIPADRPSPPASRLLHNQPKDNLDKEEGEKEEGVNKGRRSMVVVDDQGQRRLDYSSLCSQMNTFVATTHDDFKYNRWDDRTTFYAFVSNHPPCPGDGGAGAWFWTGTAWSCFEPDHDPNIEFAYGGCFGRCGFACGDNNGAGAYTYDCLDHNSCVRFGHSVASPFCNDEFLTTVDDAVFAPNCI